MERQRYKELQTGPDPQRINAEEWKEGWRWCNDCDGDLINIYAHQCPCLEDKPHYMTKEYSEVLKKEETN